MQGMRGLQKGCCGPDVWGVSSNAPRFWEDSEFLNIQSFSYDIYGSGINAVEITPEISPRQSGQSWQIFATKVPSHFPAYNHCGEQAFRDDNFLADLGAVGSHDTVSLGVERLKDPRVIHSSRAVYEDGKQRFVVYETTPQLKSPNFRSINGDFFENLPFLDSVGHQDVYIIDIAQKETIAIHKVGLLDQMLPNGTIVDDPTEMEQFYLFADGPVNGFIRPPAVLWIGEIGSEWPQFGANGRSLGREYYVTSGYSPTRDKWGIARVKYEGTRRGSPGIEVFSSDRQVGDTTLTYENDHVIMLPSVRVYIDSQAEQPDECWVCAKTITGDPELVTGKWLDKVYAPGYSGSDAEYEWFADGTLSPEEIENTILPTAQTDSDFPDEEWNNLQVRCYQRIWDEQLQGCKDLLLFTSETEPLTATPLADFEDEYDDNPELDINVDMPPEAQFSAGGSASGSQGWLVETDDSHSPPFSLKSDDNKTFQNTTTLRITIHVLTASTISFWYRHDNRAPASADPFSPLTFIPLVENNFVFKDNGEIKLDVTNSGFTSHAEHETWYQHTENLAAGTHTLSWEFNRFWAFTSSSQAVTGTWIDDIQFPEIMLGDDINGGKRWYYDGTEVRQLKWWAWAKRNEEDATDLGARARTIPDYITMDWDRNIWIGNPHYLLKIKPDGELDEEFGETFETGGGSGRGLRWTASPNDVPAEDAPCWDPDPRTISTDQIEDPEWGSFQILPTRNSIQLRGVDGALRDASDDVIEELQSKFEDEEFKDLLRAHGTGQVGSVLWSQRAQGWTISLDGKTRIPHYEVIWRMTKDQPAWPDASPYPVPPYRTGFENADHTDEFAHLWGAVRPRDVRFIDRGSEKPRWQEFNWLVSRTYCDTFSRSPQMVWIRFTDRDPPSDPEDPDYWHPDTPDEFGGQGPYPSARYFPHQARYQPTGNLTLYVPIPATINLECTPDDPFGEITVDQVMIHRIQIQRASWTDFDAVDCDCPCCKD